MEPRDIPPHLRAPGNVAAERRNAGFCVGCGVERTKPGEGGFSELYGANCLSAIKAYGEQQRAAAKKAR